MGLGAWILWQLRDRVRAGVLFALYLLYAGAERFLIEFLRRNSDPALGLTFGAAGEPCDDRRRRGLDAIVVRGRTASGRLTANDAVGATA